MLISSLFTRAVAFAALGSWSGGCASCIISVSHSCLEDVPPRLSLVWTDLHAFDPARLVAPLSAVGQGKIGPLRRCPCTIHLRLVSDRHNGVGQTRPTPTQPLIRFPQVHLKMSSIWVRAEVRAVAGIGHSRSAMSSRQHQHRQAVGAQRLPHVGESLRGQAIQAA